MSQLVDRAARCDPLEQRRPVTDLFARIHAQCGQERLLVAIERIVVVAQQSIGGPPDSWGMRGHDRIELAHETVVSGLPTGLRPTSIVGETATALQLVPN